MRLFIPDSHFSSHHSGIERGSIFLFIVNLSFLNILKPNIQKRDITVCDQDICKIRKILKSPQIHAYNGGKNTKADHNNIHINPKRQVKANRPKQREINKVTILLKVVPGVSSAAEARYFGSLPSSNQAAPFSVSHTLPIITTKPVNVQITMVSRKTPIA